MKAQLEAIRSAALEAINGTQTTAELDAVRVQYLGKKGELTAVLKQMGKLSPEERPVMGQMANDVRAALEVAIESQSAVLAEKALADKLAAETLDVTIPGKEVKIGHKHPMYLALDEIKDIFVGMGFTVLDGPEVELATYNFDKLNAEEGHPSRDWSDTFYFDEDSRVMLRSQTSPMQVRAMETMELPIRIIAPGRVYRKDEVDATHSPMFHQVEGMVIDKNVTMADLKGTLNTVVEKLYGRGTKTRFRPHHFPFTEPSCEMDVQCHKCGGVGCPTCKGEGWIELLGAGVLAGDGLVAGLHGHGDFLAVHHAAGADGDDFSHRGLFLGRASQDDAALGGFFGLDHLQDDAICKRSEFHLGFLLIDIKKLKKRIQR